MRMRAHARSLITTDSHLLTLHNVRARHRARRRGGGRGSCGEACKHRAWPLVLFTSAGRLAQWVARTCTLLGSSTGVILQEDTQLQTPGGSQGRRAYREYGGACRRALRRECVARARGILGRGRRRSFLPSFPPRRHVSPPRVRCAMPCYALTFLIHHRPWRGG